MQTSYLSLAFIFFIILKEEEKQNSALLLNVKVDIWK